MMNKALLAATLASGLILPAEAGVSLPPKPAIIKPRNIEFSKNLLAMPITMGMFRSSARVPGTIAYVGGGSSASTTATTITSSRCRCTATPSASGRSDGGVVSAGVTPERSRATACRPSTGNARLQFADGKPPGVSPRASPPLAFC